MKAKKPLPVLLLTLALLALTLLFAASLPVALGADGEGNGNQVNANFDTSQNYSTQEDSVANTTLEGGWTSLNANLNNQEDGSGADIVGTSAGDGPVLDLLSTSTVSDVRNDNLTSGTTPGTNFTWDFPAIAQNNGDGCYANLQETASFSPGFSVTRSADVTTFDLAGGTQVLTLTITTAEAMDRLNLNGNVQPGGYADYTASLVSVEWEGDPPDSDLDSSGSDFWGGINNPAVGTYTLLITTQVASTLPGVDITYMPYLQIGNQQNVANSSEPVSGSSLAHTVADDSTWTWTAVGTYLWNWNEARTKAVHLNGYVNTLSAPVITGIDPATGPAGGGTSVTITGSNLTGATAVTFGGAPATYTVDFDTQITATAPAHDLGTVEVVVTTAGGSSAPASYTFYEVSVETVLDFFDQAVGEGTLVGSGPSKSATGHLKALRNMLLQAETYLDKGKTSKAIAQLEQVYLCCDGVAKPPDFVSGSAAAELAAMVHELIDDLSGA